jgi:hypothetical protein
MLSLLELNKLLSLNEALLLAEMFDGVPNRRSTDMKRLLELQLHRFEIMKCIIEEQTKLLSQNEIRRVA